MTDVSLHMAVCKGVHAACAQLGNAAMPTSTLTSRSEAYPSSMMVCSSTRAHPSSTLSPGAAPTGTALWFLKPMAWKGCTVLTSCLTCASKNLNIVTINSYSIFTVIILNTGTITIIIAVSIILINNMIVITIL